MYRSTVNTTTQETPSMLFLKKMVNRNTTSKEEIVRRPGDEVLIRDYRKRHEKWISGSVIRKIGTLMYEILADGVTWKRHIDQILFYSPHYRENSKKGCISCEQSP